MLRIVQFVFGLLILSLSIYSVITNNYKYQSFMMLSLGAMTLIMGISELQKKRKVNATILMLSSAFVLFVSVYTL
ncbi:MULTISPECIES: YczI family protein [Bacillus]|uniref:YczI family protein n=1 Tax=Bacillus TaxID=1386 RepID=UPI0002DB2139|nr:MULTISPECIES: YczI family protein [Bacillus]